MIIATAYMPGELRGRCVGTHKHRTGVPDQTLRKLAGTAFLDPERLVNAVRRGLGEIQHRPHLIDGVLAETGLTVNSGT